MLATCMKTSVRMISHSGVRHLQKGVKLIKPIKSNKTKAQEAIERNKLEKLMFGGVMKAEKKTAAKRKTSKEDTGTAAVYKARQTEAAWLAGSDLKNLKLFRKTTSGRYKEVDKEKLLKALGLEAPKELAKAVEENEIVKVGLEDVTKQISEIKPPALELVTPQEVKVESQTTKKPPILADIVIKNITSYPLLGSKSIIEIKDKIDTALYPSVTKVLGQTMSDSAKEALERWRQNLIAQLGEEGFRKLEQDQLEKGSRFHSIIKQFLTTRDKGHLVIDSTMEGCWNSVSSILERIGEVDALEKRIYHPVLLYKGVVDCVATYQDVPCVIEWKKSDKPKATLNQTYDAPLQLCAYLGALSHFQGQQTVKQGVVVVAYSDGSPANVFQLDLKSCIRYWELWLARLQMFWTQYHTNKSVQE